MAARAIDEDGRSCFVDDDNYIGWVDDDNNWLGYVPESGDTTTCFEEGGTAATAITCTFNFV